MASLFEIDFAAGMNNFYYLKAVLLYLRQFFIHKIFISHLLI